MRATCTIASAKLQVNILDIPELWKVGADIGRKKEVTQMETVEVVIRIPKELYKVYKGRPPMLGDAGIDMIAQSIANGTLLPKNHGRLVDADKISRVNYAEEDNLTGYGMTYDEMGAYNDGINDMYRLVKNAPTVIEADKEA